MMMVLQLQGCKIHRLVGLEQAPPHMLELLHRLKALQSQEHKWEQEQELGLEHGKMEAYMMALVCTEAYWVWACKLVFDDMLAWVLALAYIWV